MSFIGEVKKGTTYTPGWFLAHNDETCTRETKEIAQSGAVETASGKYVPMGTPYPSNDGYCIGLLYEDVDVTTGNMPGSVVTKGEVYEDRVAITGADYDAVTVGDYVSPKDEGWYESDGQDPATYTLSTDTKANAAKTYYAKSGDEYSAVTVGDYVSPKAQGWYESDGGSGYVASEDTEADGLKTYYTKTDVRLSSAAKSALQALGFKFIATAPAVTRPY